MDNIILLIVVFIFGGKKSEDVKSEENLIILEINLPHIDNLPDIIDDDNFLSDKLIHVLETGKYSNPLPAKYKGTFWAFYPLAHFQSFIFKRSLQLNDYHLKVISKNTQFKPFTKPNLKFLQIGQTKGTVTII